MDKHFINFGTYNDHRVDNHQEITINTSAANAAEIVRAFVKNNAEDVQAEEAPQLLPFFVPEKFKELDLYTYEQFEQMYRQAAEADAKTLADFLNKYSQLGVLDFKGYDKKEMLAILQAYFPTMKRYSYNNFVYYF